jgi:phage gpG-like protein
MSDLTEENKQFIRDNFEKHPDLNEMTRRVFDDPYLDGRSKGGRAVREYMQSEGLEYKTTKIEPAKEVVLTKDDKAIIDTYSEEGLNSYQIAVILYPDKNITPLSKASLVVSAYIKEANKGRLSDKEKSKRYIPEKAFQGVLEKINVCAGVALEREELNLRQRMCIEQLMNFLQSPRFVQVVDGYSSDLDKELFESEFIRATWDKPDLTSDEINLYINVCMEYINLKHISKAMDKLNSMFDDAETQQEMTVRLAELLKTKSEEYNQCEKRMESLIQKLQGDRSKRILAKQKQNASLLNLVQLFQSEEERKIMIKIAELQRMAVEDEVEELEKMPEWKARVLGITKNDAV